MKLGFNQFIQPILTTEDDDEFPFVTFQAVTIGEMSGNVLMDLSVLADEVIGPMLCNPENQKGWPKIVQNDMKRHVNDLRNLMHQVRM